MNMSQYEMIVQYMKEKGSITTFEAFTELGIVRLGARISEMRRSGYKITSETVSSKNRYGKPIRYNRYFLVDEGA